MFSYRLDQGVVFDAIIVLNSNLGGLGSSLGITCKLLDNYVGR